MFPFGELRETSLLMSLFVSFLSGAIAALLVKVGFNTFRQVKHARQRAKAAKLERDVAEAAPPPPAG